MWKVWRCESDHHADIAFLIRYFGLWKALHSGEFHGHVVLPLNQASDLLLLLTISDREFVASLHMSGICVGVAPANVSSTS